jgi:hypothetical protein
MNLLLQQSVGGSSGGGAPERGGYTDSGGGFRSNSTTPLPPPQPPSRDGHHGVPPQPPPRSGRLNHPMQQHFDVVSPPLSGRSTPKAHVPNVMPRGQESTFMHKYHTVTIILLYSWRLCIIYF